MARRMTGEAVAGENPIVAGMAGRYATALFELALEADVVDGVDSDLSRFNELLAASADLMRLVRSPTFTVAEQANAIEAVLDRVGIRSLAAQFLKVVTANRRLFAVADIIKTYRLLVAQHKGEVSAAVTVAEPLSARHLGEIKSTLDGITGKAVRVDVNVDPTIIGGLIVRLGSRMVDSSLRTKLNGLRHAMKEVG
jgi:F-type H+-transporting ATPase subunit delta